MADRTDIEPVLRDIALWTASLVRQFPELAEELAPGRRGPAGTAPAPPPPAATS